MSFVEPGGFLGEGRRVAPLVVLLSYRSYHVRAGFQAPNAVHATVVGPAASGELRGPGIAEYHDVVFGQPHIVFIHNGARNGAEPLKAEAQEGGCGFIQDEGNAGGFPLFLTILKGREAALRGRHQVRAGRHWRKLKSTRSEEHTSEL